MIINQITLKNFQLFKEQVISFDKLNLITGTNLDDIASSGNGAGKTTILSALLFGLFGEVTDINLKELVKIGTKEAEVSIALSHNNKNIFISRKIPSALIIQEDGKEIQFNNPTLAQKYLNEIFGTDFQHFRTYNLIDQKKGINLLDLGTISLRKALMEFCANQFTEIRNNLLAKKLERETYNVNKRLYRFHLSDKRLSALETGLKKTNEDINNTFKDTEEQNKVVQNLLSEITSREKIIYFKKKDLEKLNKGICPALGRTCQELKESLGTAQEKIDKEITSVNKEIEEIHNLLANENEALHYYEDALESLRTKLDKTKQFIMKLKEAQKFSAYKYTKEDVQLYADAIKALDSFSAYYIQEWLQNLAIIINDLLKELNLSVEFSIEKDFIRIKNKENELFYSQLSNGQRTFLGVIFKLGILLQEGKNDGLILIDEGINSIDQINLNKLIDILKGLNFQVCLIYQNIEKSIQEVNYINVIRKEGVSNVR